MGGGWRVASGRKTTHSWLKNCMCRGEDDLEDSEDLETCREPLLSLPEVLSQEALKMGMGS